MRFIVELPDPSDEIVQDFISVTERVNRQRIYDALASIFGTTGLQVMIDDRPDPKDAWMDQIVSISPWDYVRGITVVEFSNGYHAWSHIPHDHAYLPNLREGS